MHSNFEYTKGTVPFVYFLRKNLRKYLVVSRIFCTFAM